MVVAKRVENIGPSGVYFTFFHACLESLSDAIETIQEFAADRYDTYFALASYRQGFHEGPPDSKTGRRKRVLRVRDNVEALKALWLDIDFKKGYANPAAAVAALQAFCKVTGLPAPAILVGSGNGVHVYWPLDEAVSLDRWLRLSEALKRAAKQHDLKADLACTGDACRVLRPPGTWNFKDPAAPKPVKILYASGKTFDYNTLDAALLPWVRASAPISSTISAAVLAEFTGGIKTSKSEPSQFEEIVKHCAVAKHHADTHGKDATEPEWTAMLQLLRHCEDGEQWVHSVSNGHLGYSERATEIKWRQRQQNTAGPTLCSTFEAYRKAACQLCPHYGFVKTPLQLGIGDVAPVDGLPFGWRAAPNKAGIERLMVIDRGSGKTEQEWVKVLRHIPVRLRATRSVVTGRYDIQFDVSVRDSRPWSVHLPGAALGNPRKLTEQLADCGLVFKGSEPKSFQELMSTWLEKLQAARRIADVTENLGWLIIEEGGEQKFVGFSCGSTTFYADGRVRNDVRAAREFREIAKMYEPKGTIEPWKKVAKFVAEQNNPAFTAILAAAFGTPLLRFTGQAGAVLSIVSSASGVGKSSALKVSQAVWGAKDGINSVDDTPKSVARKLGFLKSLPAYWDELRGKQTVEEFTKLAFQITQGKERMRLDSNAAVRETGSWDTMVVVASNESIFDAMARYAAGTDAGVVRAFEMNVEPFESDRNRAEIALLFEHISSNYGHAGRVYAQYLASHAPEVEQRVNNTFVQLAKIANMQASERYWFAVITILIVGAKIANELKLTEIDVRSMTSYLLQNLTRLRTRTSGVRSMLESNEVLAAFLQTYQDRALHIDKFPSPRQNGRNYLPDISGGTPRADKLAYVFSREEKLLRIPQQELRRWLDFRGLPVYSTITRMEQELGMKTVRVRLGIGTKWELPPQRCYEVSTKHLDEHFDAMAAQVTPDDSLRPADSPDSQPETEP
jgi:hypothetical protein